MYEIDPYYKKPQTTKSTLYWTQSKNPNLMFLDVTYKCHYMTVAEIIIMQKRSTPMRILKSHQSSNVVSSKKKEPV